MSVSRDHARTAELTDEVDDDLRAVVNSHHLPGPAVAVAVINGDNAALLPGAGMQSPGPATGQAARRQAKRRQNARVKARHAQAERERRERAKLASQAVEGPGVVPERGHGAEIFFNLALRSARLLRIACEFTPQPGTLLLSHLPSSRSQCSRPRTQVARAAAWTAGRSGSSTTVPPASAACYGKPTSLTRYRSEHCSGIGVTWPVLLPNPPQAFNVASKAKDAVVTLWFGSNTRILR